MAFARKLISYVRIEERKVSKGFVVRKLSHSLEFPTSDWNEIYEMTEDFDKYKRGDPRRSQFLWLPDWIDRYGFDGGRDGETLYTGVLSLGSFINHACDHDPSVSSFLPDGIMEDYWTPIYAKYQTELQHVVRINKDHKPGDMILDDYTAWDQTVFSTPSEEIQKWCGKSEQRRLLFRQRRLQNRSP